MLSIINGEANASNYYHAVFTYAPVEKRSENAKI